MKRSTIIKIKKSLKGRPLPWMEHIYLRGKDLTKWTVTNCKICNNLINHLKSEKRIYCSLKCRYNDKQEIIKRAKKAMITNTKKGTFKKHSIRMKNGGALKALKKCRRISKWQKEIYNKIKQIYPDAKLEYRIKTLDGVKSVDIFIPSLKQCIECDGTYWHKFNYYKDYKRQKAIEYLGYKVYRIKESDYNASNWSVPEFQKMPKSSC